MSSTTRMNSDPGQSDRFNENDLSKIPAEQYTQQKKGDGPDQAPHADQNQTKALEPISGK